MQISSRRDGGAKFYIPNGLKSSGKEVKPIRPIASANTSLQQRTAKPDAQIMCKRINEEPVKINREADRKEFVPLAIAIERKRKAAPAESEPAKKQVVEAKAPQPSSQLNVLNIRDQPKQPLQAKTVKKPEQSKKPGKTQPKGPKAVVENRASSLLSNRNSVKSPNNASKQDINVNFSRKLAQTKETERSKSRESSRQDFSSNKAFYYQTLPFRSNTSHSKSKITTSTEKNPLKTKKSEHNEIKPRLSEEFDHMIKENARKLLEEKKRQKEEELKQREFEVKKKHLIIEEDQKKVRQFNRQYVHTDRQNPGKYAWGIDQRKFNQHTQQSARERTESSPFEANRKNFKLDEKERREKLGLGQLSNDKLNKGVRKSRAVFNEEEKQQREEGSVGRGRVIKKLISPEQEQKLKEFMGLQRQKMEEYNRSTLQDKPKEKLRIKENLNRLREEQKTLSQGKNARGTSIDPGSAERENKKSKVKNGSKNLYYGDKTSNTKNKEFMDHSGNNLLEQNQGQQSLSFSEDDHNYSLLYNEYRKIINEKQILNSQQEPSKTSEDVSYSHGSSRQNYYATTKTKNTTGTKGFSDKNSARSDTSNHMHSNHERDEHAPQAKNKATDEKTAMQRREQVKKQFIDLAKRLEDALGSNENASVENLSNRQFVEKGPYHMQNARNEENQSIGLNAPDEENKFFNEFGDSNFVEENNLKDKSLESVEYREPKEEEQEEEIEDDGEPKSRTDVNSEENRLNLGPNEEEGDEENLFNDDEAYQHNYGIIEAAAIFIQKNFRGYLTRKILKEYFDEMNAIQHYDQEEEFNHDKEAEGLQAEEEKEFPLISHRRLTRSLDERILSAHKGIDEEDEEYVIEENAGPLMQGEQVFDEKYLDIYEKISKKMAQESQDQDNEANDNFYQDLNEKLRMEMLMQNAAQYERKNKFLEDEPKIGNEQLDISIDDDEDDEEKQRKLTKAAQGGQNLRETAAVTEYKKERSGGSDKYRRLMIEEVRPLKPTGKAQTQKEMRGDDEERPKRRYRRNKSDNLSDSSLKESNEASDRENAIFAGPFSADQEKLVMISTINSEEDLVEGVANNPDHQGPYSEDNSLDRQMAAQSGDWEEQRNEEPDIPEASMPRSEHLDIMQGKSRNHNGLSIKEINDNSKSLITVGVDDECDREHLYPDKFRADIKVSKTSLSKEDFDEERKRDSEEEKKDGERTAQLTQSNEKELLQKTIEITSIYHHELARVREEQAKKISDIINQLSFLQNSDSDLSTQTKYFIENLQNQLEENKKTLQETFEFQKAAKANHLTLSEDKSLLNELEYLVNRQSTQSNLTSMQNTMNLQKDFTQELGLSTINARESKFGLGTYKKKNLLIDTDTINRDLSEEKKKSQLAHLIDDQELLNLDITQMRLTLGSEKLIREQSVKTLSNTFITPTGMNDRAHINDFNRSAESGSSIFERDTFKEFTNKKFRELLKQENINHMIKMREQALEFRHNSQVEFMKKMLENKRVSPRTFQHRKLELEKWVTREREQIKKSRKNIQKGWTSYAEAMKRTQRDLEFMKKVASGDKRNGLNELHLVTDEESNVFSAKRLPFKSDGEAGESDMDYSSHKIQRMRGIFQQENMFGTPGSSKNALNVLQQFEFQQKEKSKLMNNFIGAQAEDADGGSVEGASPTPKKLGNQLKPTGINYDKKAPAIGEYHPEDSESLSFEGSLKDTAALKQRLKDLNIQLQDKEKDSEFEEHIKDLSALQEELNQMGNSGRNVFNLKSPQEDQMLSSKGFGMNKGTGAVRVGETSAEFNKKIHRELQQINESVKDVQRDLFSDIGMSPNGDNARVFERNAFTSPKNIEIRMHKSPENLEAQNSAEARFGFRKSGLEAPNPTSLDSNYLDRPQSELSKFIEDREGNLDQFGSPKMEGKIPYHQEHEYICPGFFTGVDAVHEFLNLLCHVIEGEYKNEFLSHINTPMGLPPDQKLSSLHNYDPSRSSLTEYLTRSFQKPVLSYDLFAQIDERIKEEFSEKDTVLLEMESFHYRGIFNAFNEALDYYRPFGMLGIPYPWKSNKIFLPREIKEEQLELILDRTKEKVLIWCSFVCGYLPNGEFLSENDDCLNQIREDKLMRLLAREVADTEERWVSYENDETEVQMEISDLIFDRLAQEAAQALLEIKARKYEA